MKTRVISVNRILLAVFAIAIVIVVTLFGILRVQANHALRRAKDVSLSLRLLSIYSDRGEYEVYDPYSFSGLSPQAEAELAQLAQIQPENLRVSSWNEELDLPQIFVYSEEHCVVTYKLKSDQKVEWEVEYRLRLIHFK